MGSKRRDGIRLQRNAEVKNMTQAKAFSAGSALILSCSVRMFSHCSELTVSLSQLGSNLGIQNKNV